jgi:hypothetical protein
MENIAEQGLRRLLIIDVEGAACCIIHSETEYGVHFVSDIHADCSLVVEKEWKEIHAANMSVDALLKQAVRPAVLKQIPSQSWTGMLLTESLNACPVNVSLTTCEDDVSSKEKLLHDPSPTPVIPADPAL